jgi:hypothetical protein
MERKSSKAQKNYEEKFASFSVVIFSIQDVDKEFLFSYRRSFNAVIF